MINFFKRVYKKINKYDTYTRKYQEFSNNIEFPPFAYTNWGLYLAELKDYDAAIEKLETAVMMYGKNPKPCISLGIIYAKLRNWEKAEQSLKEAITRESKNAYAHTVLSSVYVASDKLAQAEEEIKKALKLSPFDAEIYLNYGIFYAKQQKKIKAIEMFKKSKYYDHTNLHTFFLLGVMYFEVGKTEDAYAEFKLIEKVKPNYKKLNYYIALCLEREKQYSMVAEYGEKAVKAEPKNPEIYMLLAQAYFNIQEKQRVYEIYKRAIEEDVKNFELCLSAGIIFSRYDDIELAKMFLEKALEISPNDSNANYRMGVCLNREGKQSEALESLDKAIQSNPENSHAIAQKGLIKYEQKEYNEAVNLLLQALGLSRSSDYLYFYIANCYYKLGKLKRSIEYYEKTLEYHPKHLETLINLTICFLETNNGKDALRKARSAYQTDRESRKVILIYALADLKCGIYSDAIEKADILLSRNEEDTEAKLIKIHALICLRKAKDAINILDTLNEGIKTSEIFIFLSYLTYKILVEENQSDYNKNMLKLYMDKIEEIDTETIQETGLIDYILKK